MANSKMITVRVDGKTKDEFTSLARSYGFSASEVLRASMERMLRDGEIPIPVRAQLGDGTGKILSLESIAKAVGKVMSGECGAKVRRVSLFGSYARGEALPRSDVDLLLEYDEGFGIFELVTLGEELEERLIKKIDLLTKGSLSDETLASALRDAKVIYERK